MRVMVVVGVLCGFLLFLAATQSEATPIRPNVKKLLNQPPPQQMHFAPARAGWNGPEIAQSGAGVNPILFGSSLDAQAVRDSVISALIPDPRMAALLLAVILLLRQFRNWRSSRTARPRPAESPAELPAQNGPQELRPAA